MDTSSMYATVYATHRYGYGHIVAQVHDFFPFSSTATLKLSCQTGGSCSESSYAWNHGIANDLTVVGLREMNHAHPILRRIARQLDKVATTEGSPECFADYVLRVLHAAKVFKLHVLEEINGAFPDVERLPTFDLRKDPLGARKLIDALESNLLLRG